MPKTYDPITCAKIQTLLDNGRIEISTKEELEEYPLGSLISYMNNNHILKSGGFVTKFSDDYFIYITPDFGQKYRVRYINVHKMWVGDVKKVKNDLISLTKTTQKKTNFPVTVNGVIIYYAHKKFDQNRFMNTQKYKRIVEWNNYFNDS